jgi:hypothetical protein
MFWLCDVPPDTAAHYYLSIATKRKRGKMAEQYSERFLALPLLDRNAFSNS